MHRELRKCKMATIFLPTLERMSLKSVFPGVRLGDGEVDGFSFIQTR